MEDDLNLRILGVDAGDEIAGARRLDLKTTRGAIRCVLHSVAQPDRAAVCVCGAIGGLDGPAALYPRLGLEMPASGIAILRLDYRVPNELAECVLDAMAGLAFLKGTGHSCAAVIGHSFGGAVAISAGTLSPFVSTVVAISSQLDGAQMVGELKPRPLLLLHGTADAILPPQSSEAIYERASEPKTLKLFPAADHRLSQVGDELFDTVRQWLLEKC